MRNLWAGQFAGHVERITPKQQSGTTVVRQTFRSMFFEVQVLFDLASAELFTQRCSP